MENNYPQNSGAEKRRRQRPETAAETPNALPSLTEWLRGKIYGFPTETPTEIPYRFGEAESPVRLRATEEPVTSDFFRRKAFPSGTETAGSSGESRTVPASAQEPGFRPEPAAWEKSAARAAETEPVRETPLPLEGELLLPKYFDFRNSAGREIRHIYPAVQPETQDEMKAEAAPAYPYSLPAKTPAVHPVVEAQPIELPAERPGKEEILRDLLRLEQEREQLAGKESSFDLALAKRLGRTARNLLNTRTQAEHDRLDNWYEKAANQVMAGLEAIGNRPADAYLTLGYSDLAHEIGVLDILNRAAKQKPLTRSEELVLKQYAQLMRANDYLAGQGGAVLGSRVGEGVSQTTDYLVPAGWTHSLLKAGGKTLGRKLARKAAAAALTPLATSSTGRKAVERLTGNYGLETHPGVPTVRQTENPVGLGEALGKGYMSGLAEAISEQGGAVLGYMPRIMKTPASQMGRWLARNARKLEGPQGDTFRKMLQWHGFTGELAEEYLSGAIEPLMTGEPERIRENFTAQNMLETAITTAAVSSIMGGAAQVNGVIRKGGKPQKSDTEMTLLEKAAQEHSEARKAWKKINDPVLRKELAEATTGDFDPTTMWLRLEQTMQGRHMSAADMRHMQTYLTRSFSRDIAFNQALEAEEMRKEKKLEKELDEIKNLLAEENLQIYRKPDAEKGWSYSLRPAEEVPTERAEAGEPIEFRQFSKSIYEQQIRQWEQDFQQQRQAFIAGNLVDLGGDPKILQLNEIQEAAQQWPSFGKSNPAATEKPKSTRQTARQQTEENLRKLEAEPPSGVGPFGPIFSNYQGRTLEGVYQLLQNKSGELTNVYYRPELGNIDIIWKIGTERGLRHAVGKHTKGPNAYESVEDFVKNMDETIANGRLLYRQGLQHIFEYNGNRLVINQRVKDPTNPRIVIRKNWIVTMYRVQKPDQTDGNGERLHETEERTTDRQTENDRFSEQNELSEQNGSDGRNDAGTASSEFPFWGRFGPITTEYRGRTEEGVQWLKKQKGGELADMYAVEGVDDHISLIWGTSSERGLRTTLTQKIGEGKDYASTEEMVRAMDDVMRNGTVVVPKTDRVIVMGKGDDRVALYHSGIKRKPTYRHSKPTCWVMSVYKKRNLPPYRLPEGFTIFPDEQTREAALRERKNNPKADKTPEAGWEQLPTDLQTLLKEQSGFMRMETANPQLDIDIVLPWGSENYGLRRIIEKHIVQIGSYSSIDDMIQQLQTTLDLGEAYKSPDGKIIVNYGNNQVIMSNRSANGEDSAYSIISMYTTGTPTYEKLRE